METATVPSRSNRRPHRRHESPRPLIISEQLFRGALMKERKRADRLNQPLVLLIVALKDRVDAQSPSIWVPVIEALATVTRETDVLGWFEAHTAIGVVLPEVHDVEAVRKFDSMGSSPNARTEMPSGGCPFGSIFIPIRNAWQPRRASRRPTSPNRTR
jgi:hypothetical protein